MERITYEVFEWIDKEWKFTTILEFSNGNRVYGENILSAIWNIVSKEEFRRIKDIVNKTKPFSHLSPNKK